MLPIRAEDGTTVAFIGRAHPHSRHDTPKYLNSPETVLFTKGDMLFGLHEARAALGRGARPVIVEGPFDAIAVNIADLDRFAGVAPLGTALTSVQATALSRAADLDRAGVLVALDGDQAGHNAATKAYGVLRTVTATIDAVLLPSGRDPAEILQSDGPAALRSALRADVRPLADLVTDATIDSWDTRTAEGQIGAMRAAASLIASTRTRRPSSRTLFAVRCRRSRGSIRTSATSTPSASSPMTTTHPRTSQMARSSCSPSITRSPPARNGSGRC